MEMFRKFTADAEEKAAKKAAEDEKHAEIKKRNEE